MTLSIIFLCAYVFTIILYIINRFIALRSIYPYEDITDEMHWKKDTDACDKTVKLLSTICRAILAIGIMTFYAVLVVDRHWNGWSVVWLVILGILIIFAAFVMAVMSFVPIAGNRIASFVLAGIYALCVTLLIFSTIYLCTNCSPVTNESDGTIVIEENLALDEVKEYYGNTIKFEEGDREYFGSTAKIEFIECESSKPYAVIRDYTLKELVQNKEGKILYELSSENVHDVTLYIPIN